ncbi:baculoviral IAP repeat-containing protein 7-A-like [Bombus affinis]|uniref:baculoviral IAP repeat-containing protein 7-A-like n=1 Tax=Bombus affinis TaxID=309941 RepID=UPI0021B7A6B3|nr:baculoviral IAP repeat-containing protein 7-A-like [Bombus affinis]
MSSDHAISSGDSTSSINSISADDSAAAVPSTSAARPVHLISPRHSTSSMTPLIPGFPMSPKPQIPIRRRSRYVPNPYGIEYHESFNFNDHRFLKYLRNPTAYELSRLGLNIIKKPENSEYASYVSRLNSFTTWPTYMRQTKEELADAGFYYIGIDDFTTCYQCGLGIGNWKPEEDPWEQHAISSPTCCYLLTRRGFEYVNNVTGQQLYETSPKVSTITYTQNHMYN